MEHDDTYGPEQHTSTFPEKCQTITRPYSYGYKGLDYSLTHFQLGSLLKCIFNYIFQQHVSAPATGAILSLEFEGFNVQLVCLFVTRYRVTIIIKYCEIKYTRTIN
jgi:hypothetical protein